MKIIKGDIWKFHLRGEWICVTTNGMVKNNGCAVMGKGTAKQCAVNYPNASRLLGNYINKYGNVVGWFMDPVKIISFPVKHTWWEIADIDLIEKSARTLIVVCTMAKIERVYLPKPGCGNGGLDWKDVKKVLKPILDDRFIVVEYNPS